MNEYLFGRRCKVTIAAPLPKIFGVGSVHIGPATASYIARAIDLASERGDAYLADLE